MLGAHTLEAGMVHDGAMLTGNHPCWDGHFTHVAASLSALENWSSTL